MSRTVLAIDPGSSKCGVAIVRREGMGRVFVDWRSIVPTTEIVNAVTTIGADHPFDVLLVGSGTSSRQLLHTLREAFPSKTFMEIEEHDTTQQARERYWEYHKRLGWRRFIPASLQVPPEPVDDFAAVVIAERVLLASA